MRVLHICLAVCISVMALAAGQGRVTEPARAAQALDVKLVLAADVSRSINDAQFDLQRRGYAAALTNPRVLDAIRAGRHGAITVCFLEWAGEGEQKTVVDWTLIRDADDARQFAAALLEAPRSYVGRTASRYGIAVSMAELGESAF